MEVPNKILLATDYSDAVKYAEEYAIKLAVKTNAVLIILHVYHFPLVESPSRPADYGMKQTEHEKIELELLAEHRDELLERLKVSPEQLPHQLTTRDSTTIASEIAREAEKTKADLIIVGTHGSTGMKKLFFGTHAWEVIKKASLPVLAIPPYSALTKIKNIVFATEYRAEEIPIIRFLAELAGRYSAKLMIVHVTNYALSKKFEEEMLQEFRDEIRYNIKYEKTEVVSCYNEEIEKGLNHFCAQTKADWLVLVHKKHFLLERLFLKSISKKMSFESKIPLLVIPETFNPEKLKTEKLVAAVNKNYPDEEF